MGGGTAKAAKIIAVLLCLVLAATFILCGMTCARHATHLCGGSDCRICDLLQNTDKVLKQLSLALMPAGMAAAACGLLLFGGCAFYAYCASAASLVRLKIRLDY